MRTYILILISISMSIVLVYYFIFFSLHDRSLSPLHRHYRVIFISISTKSVVRLISHIAYPTSCHSLTLTRTLSHIRIQTLNREDLPSLLLYFAELIYLYDIHTYIHTYIRDVYIYVPSSSPSSSSPLLIINHRCHHRCDRHHHHHHHHHFLPFPLFLPPSTLLATPCVFAPWPPVPRFVRFGVIMAGLYGEGFGAGVGDWV